MLSLKEKEKFFSKKKRKLFFCYKIQGKKRFFNWKKNLGKSLEIKQTNWFVGLLKNHCNKIQGKSLNL